MINVVHQIHEMEVFIIMERKEIIKVLGDHFGVKPMYMGTPSFAYQIETAEETYTVDREGKITTSAGEEAELEVLLGETNSEEVIEPTTFEVTVPMEGHTGITLRNLVNMIYSKQALIKKSLGITANIVEDDFCMVINEAKAETLEDFKTAIEGIGENSCPGINFDFNNKTITFKFLEGEASGDKAEAYTHFVALLNQKAMALKHASAKAKDTDNDKFTFRVFLTRLGMVGNEYKVARKVLLERLEGNSAFRSGKKPENESCNGSSC